MYTRKKYKVWDMIKWTRRELRFFIIIAIIVTVFYEVLGFGWLQIPWTPIALLGTAVAFLIGFQSNAAYGRIWEARQIWGGIVNDSRMLGIIGEIRGQKLRNEKYQFLPFRIYFSG